MRLRIISRLLAIMLVRYNLVAAVMHDANRYLFLRIHGRLSRSADVCHTTNTTRRKTSWQVVTVAGHIHNLDAVRH